MHSMPCSVNYPCVRRPKYIRVDSCFACDPAVTSGFQDLLLEGYKKVVTGL